MSLTDTAIKKAKPGDKPVKLSDGKGLYLLVNPVGSKLWRWKYRFLGKEKVMSLGAYPDVSLAQARDGMGAARKLLASGTDPMAQRASDKITKQASAENSFQSVALLWWDHWHGAKSARHADDVMRRLKADVFPAIGARPVSEIQAMNWWRWFRRFQSVEHWTLPNGPCRPPDRFSGTRWPTDWPNATRLATSSPATCWHRARQATMPGLAPRSCPISCGTSSAIRALR